MNKNQSLAMHPVIWFSILRYLRYVLQMLRGIIIAKYLGPYYLGVWGLITLTLQYLSYMSFGIENGITVLLSISSKEEEETQNRYSSSALSGVFLTGLLTLGIGLALHTSGMELFPKFEFNQYLIMILAATLLMNVQQVFTNIFRVKKAFLRITIVELFTAATMLAIVLLVKSDKVIILQLYGMIITSLLGICIFASQFPSKYLLKLRKDDLISLMKVSFPLFIYNLSFYLIMVTPRTLVSYYYSLEELGYYTLANSIATAALLGSRSIAWAIYPEVLAHLRPGVEVDAVRKNISQINKHYSIAIFLTLFICVLLLPLLVLYLPQYRPAISSITILLLAQGILAISFGYNALAVSRERRKDVAYIGILTTICVTLLSYLVSFFNLNYLLITYVILGGALFYTILNIRLGLDILEIRKNRRREFTELLSSGSLLAILLFSIGVFTDYAFWFNITGFLLFIIIDKERLIDTWKYMKDKLKISEK